MPWSWGGGEQNSKNGWVTNNGGVVNEWGVDRSVNYYMYVCVRVCVYVCCVCMCVCVYGYIKVWVSGKMQSRFQQKMCLVYHAQNCPFLSTFETGNLNLLFYCHNCFLWILSQNRCSYFMKNCPSNLAEVYLEGFQWGYTGLGTQLCIQLMKNS